MIDQRSTSTSAALAINTADDEQYINPVLFPMAYYIDYCRRDYKGSEKLVERLLSKKLLH